MLQDGNGTSKKAGKVRGGNVKPDIF